MLIISVGMPRAGSGWHYNLIHDLVVASGGKNAREIRRKFFLSPVLTEVNCNIRIMNIPRLIPVLIPVWLGNSFVIKAHSGPSRFGRKLIQSGKIKATYIYRDPRAALLSAYEYGQRGLKDGKVNAFGHLISVEEAVNFMKNYIGIWEEWMDVQDLVLCCRYEDLLENYDIEIDRLAQYLEIPQDSERVKEVVEKYRPGQSGKDHKGLHFHKGVPERFRSLFTNEQMELCYKEFGKHLIKMGYAK
ncbi:MAG: sulfotransferase domain-containing protein [Anaerolineales bacterium]|nr:sulfotransferase domain-containing protein [Anaerolineales bacterium]